jgi:hypothetical protein
MAPASSWDESIFAAWNHLDLEWWLRRVVVVDLQRRVLDLELVP